MEELGGNSSSSVLSAAIVSNLKEEFEKIGMLFTPELEGKFAKCIHKTFEEIQFASPASLTEDVSTSTPLSEQLEEATILPPLVLQFGSEPPENECIIMGMMRDGKPEVVKNEKGSESTPAFAGFNDDQGLVYGTDATAYRACRQVWRCVHFWQPFQSVDLKEFGLFTLPHIFFISFLIRKLKISAEAGWSGGGTCQVAVLAVPMQFKSDQRLRLKEAALFAGFKDVYLVCSEGLAAYYWFHEKEREIEQKNYSKDYVIIDLFGRAVVYKRSFESDSNGQRMLVVRAVLIFLDLVREVEDISKFREMVKKNLQLAQKNVVIPIIGRNDGSQRALWLRWEFSLRAANVKDDESDKFNYFAAKGAALLSKNLGNIGLQVRNMMGSMVWIDPDKIITLAGNLLPETCVRLTLNIKHDRGRYRIRFGIGDDEAIGYLTIDGVKLETELKVSFELSWEGILKVVGVTVTNSSDDAEEDEGSKKAVKWDWVIGNQVGIANFGCSSYEECKSLLMKVVPSPNQPKVAPTASSGHRNGRQEKNKRSTKSTVIHPNDMIANAGLKKIKLESDWVERVVKTEQISMEDFGEGGNGEEVNLDVQAGETDMQIEVEEHIGDGKNKGRRND